MKISPNYFLPLNKEMILVFNPENWVASIVGIQYISANKPYHVSL